MKTLLLVRHGEANFDALSDPERELTAKGRMQVEAAGLAAARLLPEVDFEAESSALWCSPYLRARQSAEGLALAGSKQWQLQPAATPECDPHALVELIDQHCDSVLVLVAHNPLLSRLLALLIGERNQASYFDTASIALVQGESLLAGCADLQSLHHWPDYRAGHL